MGGQEAGMKARGGQRHGRYVVRVPGSGKTWARLVAGAAVLLLLAILFGGEKSLLRLASMLREKQGLSQEVVSLETENQRLGRQIDALQRDPLAVERIAREELGLVRSDEIVYRFVSPGSLAERRELDAGTRR